MRIILTGFICILFTCSLAQSGVMDSLLQIVAENKRDVQENKALNSLATEYSRKDMKKAKSYLYQSIQLAATVKNDIVLSYAYSQMVTVQMNTGAADSALYYLTLLQKLTSQTSLPVVTANYNFSAGLFYKMQGNFKRALPYMIASLRQFTANYQSKPDNANLVSMAGQNLNIGNLYNELGDYKNALHYHLTALKDFEEAANARGQSFCYQSIGNDFLNLHQYTQAIPYTRRAISLKEELKDERGLANSYGSLASIYAGLSRYDAALENNKQSLDIYKKLKITGEEAKADFAIGKICNLNGHSTEAADYFREAKRLAIQTGDSSLAAASDAALSLVFSSKEKTRLTGEKLLTSLRSAIASGNKNEELSDYQSLSDLYARNKEFEKALDYSNRYHREFDSVQNKDLQVQLTRLGQQFNVEKKEKEIELLKKDEQVNRLQLQKQKTLQIGTFAFLLLLIIIGFLTINRYRIVQRSKRLIEMEKIRNQIARDLHDDIGSNLTSIHILSKMASEQAEQYGEKRSYPSLRKISDRSSEIMESVSDIVWTINPLNDHLEQLIVRMKEFAVEILIPSGIQYTFTEEGNFSDGNLDVKTRKEFYLFFKEAVTNAVKYSQCETVTIQLILNNRFLHLTITDDGIGFDPALVKTGNGLDNFRERANSMRAAYHMDTVIGRGTVILLDVPIT